MEELDEVLETQGQTGEIPSTVKTLAILAYIGNILWALLFLLVFVMIDLIIEELVNKLPVAEMTTDQFVTYLMIGCGVLILCCIVSFIGALKMSKGKKIGFVLYAVANGIWAVLLFMGGTPQGIVCGAISVGFIIGFGTQLKHLR